MGRFLLLILLGITWMLMHSCVTYQKCVDKFGTGQDSLQVKAIIKAEIKGDTTIFQFTNKMLEAMPVNSVLSSSKSGVKSSIRKKTASDYTCEAETLTRIIEKEVQVECPPVQHFDDKPAIVYQTPFWNKLLIYVLVFALIAQAAWYYLKDLGSDLTILRRP